MSADGQLACVLDGVSPAPSLRQLIEIEEALSRLADMSHLLCDLAASADEGNELLPRSLYFFSETLLRDAEQLQEFYRGVATPQVPLPLDGGGSGRG